MFSSQLVKIWRHQSKLTLIGKQHHYGSIGILSNYYLPEAKPELCQLYTTRNPTTFYKISPCQKLGLRPPTRYFSKRRENPYETEIMDLMSEKPVDFRKIEDQLASIESETDTIMSIHTFVKMVKACAQMKNDHAPKAAERFVFKWMMKFYQQGRLDNTPTGNIFGMALHALVNSKKRFSTEKAKLFLDKLEDLAREENLPLVDTPKYSIVMKAYAIRGDVKNSLAVFDRCMHAFKQGNESARPNVFTWSTLLDACAKSKKPGAWKVAEDLFAAMQRSYKEGILKDPPNTITYSSIISACAKSKQPDRAEFWLMEMYKDYANGNIAAQPNVYSFSTAIDAWTKSGHPDAWKEAEGLLAEMEKCYKEGILKDPPNTITYNSVISACAKSKQPQRALFWLTEMHNGYQNGKAKPDSASFRSVLQAYSNAKLPNAGELADELLEKMKELQLTPDDSTLVPVMRCWECSVYHDRKAPKRLKEVQKAIDELRARSKK